MEVRHDLNSTVKNGDGDPIDPIDIAIGFEVVEGGTITCKVHAKYNRFLVISDIIQL